MKKPLATTKLAVPHLKVPKSAAAKPEAGTIVLIRTEKRSWLALAITGFGAFLVRYIRTVRERGKILRPTKAASPGDRETPGAKT